MEKEDVFPQLIMTKPWYKEKKDLKSEKKLEMVVYNKLYKIQNACDRAA